MPRWTPTEDDAVRAACAANARDYDPARIRRLADVLGRSYAAVKQRIHNLDLHVRGEHEPDPAPAPPPELLEERLLRRREVMERTSLPHSTLYAMMARGEFPRPVKLGKQAVAWPASHVQKWIAEQVARAETNR